MSTKIGSDADRTVRGAIAALGGEPTTLPLGTAIGILRETAVDGGKDAAEASRALTRTVATHASGTVRVAAARALGAVVSDPATSTLRRELARTDDGQLTAGIARALTNIGATADARRVTSAAAETAWQPAEESAQVAVRMLAHRFGKRINDMPRLPGESADPIPLPDKGVREIAKIRMPVPLRVVRPDAAWVGLTPKEPATVGAFDCGGRSNIVQATTSVAELTAGPGIAGLIHGVNESMGSTFVRWVVLTEPAGRDGELAVTVARPTGEVGFVGTGTVVGSSIQVRVRAVEAPGASAAEVTASLEGRRLTIAGQVSATRSVPRRIPDRVG